MTSHQRGRLPLIPIVISDSDIIPGRHSIPRHLMLNLG